MCLTNKDKELLLDTHNVIKKQIKLYNSQEKLTVKHYSLITHGHTVTGHIITHDMFTQVPRVIASMKLCYCILQHCYKLTIPYKQWHSPC